jgi:hypothetical protein
MTDVMSHPTESRGGRYTGKPERRIIEIPRAPSKRLWQTLHFREFKLREDRQNWAQLYHPVLTKVSLEGWRITRVTLDCGASLPLTPGKRESIGRELTMCHGDCDFILTAGTPGYGSVTVELERS